MAGVPYDTNLESARENSPQRHPGTPVTLLVKWSTRNWGTAAWNSYAFGRPYQLLSFGTTQLMQHYTRALFSRYDDRFRNGASVVPLATFSTLVAACSVRQLASVRGSISSR
jgi:hypothetical protein